MSILILNSNTNSLVLQRPWHSTDTTRLDTDFMDLDTSSATSNPASPRQLSTQLLQENVAAREAERQQRRLNGNITPRTALKTGSKFDHICAALVIEVTELNSKNKKTTYFYCIACDERRANNSRKRALPHVQKCAVCLTHSLVNICGHLFHNRCLLAIGLPLMPLR